MRQHTFNIDSFHTLKLYIQRTVAKNMPQKLPAGDLTWISITTL